ncbi:MAG TPA: DUF2461 domain-containing protein [Xanthomonadales bacterium]
MSEFNGFPKGFFTFFNQLKKNNNRDWFNANKSRYQESVVNPMCDFIRSIAPHLESISPYYNADPRPHGGSMFRVYRDTRFSNDKTPYKTHAACHFRHQAGRDAHAPGFYLHIETDGISIGGGIWRPPAKQLGQIREFIADNPAAWEALGQSADIKRMGGIQGDALQRPPRGYTVDARHIEDLKRKSFYVMTAFDAKLALSPALVTESASVFGTVAALNHFINDALELPF